MNMSTAVQITIIICMTIVAICLIGSRNNED